MVKISRGTPGILIPLFFLKRGSKGLRTAPDVSGQLPAEKNPVPSI